MIVPIMIAIVVDALRAVPRSWTEGAAALGVNRWRVTWSIAVRTARPAIVAAAVLATARALGEAIMLSMVAGSASFAPNPIDGITFLFEPTRPLASALVENVEGPRPSSLRPDPVRLRRGAPRLEHVPLAGRVRRQAVDAQVRGAAVSRPPRPAVRRRRDRSPRQHPHLAAARPDRLLPRLGRGPGADRDRRRDRHLHGRARRPVLRPRPALRQPQLGARPVRRAAASRTR